MRLYYSRCSICKLRHGEIDLSSVRQKVCAELNFNFPNASLLQPSLCFLGEYNPPFSSLYTSCFLLLPFALHYSFFLHFSLKYLHFKCAKPSLTPSFLSCTLLSVPPGLWAFLVWFLWFSMSHGEELSQGLLRALPLGFCWLRLIGSEAERPQHLVE